MNLNNEIDKYKLSSPDDWKKESIHSDYFGNQLNIGEMAFVGDYIVRKDDLRAFNKAEIRSLSIKNKLEAILNLLSITIDSDAAIIADIDDFLGTVLREQVEYMGIAEYYDMTEQRMEE